MKLAFFSCQPLATSRWHACEKCTENHGIREEYANDKGKQSQAMMELYQKEKINPLGVLPILVQMPVFIALYWVLMESVELRQAPLRCGSKISRYGSVLRTPPAHGRQHVYMQS